MPINPRIQTPSGRLEVFEVDVKEETVVVSNVPHYKNREDYLGNAKPPVFTRVSITFLKYLLSIIISYFIIDELLKYLTVHLDCKNKFTYIFFGALGAFIFMCILNLLGYLYNKKIKKYINRKTLLGV